MSTPKLDGRATREQGYEFSGRLIAVRTADERSARVAEEFLKGYHLRKIHIPKAGGADCRIDILCGSPPPLPSGLHAFEVPHGHCHTGRAGYFLSVEESRIDIAPPAGGRVTVWLGDSPNARLPVAVTNVMSYAMQAALRRCGLYDFHAAGVLEPQTGSGFLFAAPPNSGKSTLTLRLVNAGWRYLTDDMVVLSETPRGVEARGLRRLFSVSATTLAGLDLPRLDEALGTQAASDPRKRRLDPTVVFPDSHADVCTPRVLCFPRVTEEETSRVEPVGQTQAMSLLIKFNPWAGYDRTSARDHLRVLGRLVSQTRALILHSGRDLLEDHARAATLLAPYAST